MLANLLGLKYNNYLFINYFDMLIIMLSLLILNILCYVISKYIINIIKDRNFTKVSLNLIFSNFDLFLQIFKAMLSKN
jgi:hypothetical protein